MQETFTIVSKSPVLPDPWPRRPAGRLNSHYYLLSDGNGDPAGLLSKRDDYQPGEELLLDLIKDFEIGGGNLRHFVDPLLPRGAITHAHQSPSAQRTSDDNEINSDVILMVRDMKQSGVITTVAGTVFYFDPRLKDLGDHTLRDFFRNSADAPISVETPINTYYINVGQTHIFNRLQRVCLTGNMIRAHHVPRP